MKFRKKPVVIDAVQWLGDNVNELGLFAGDKFDPFTEPCDDDPDATAAVLDDLHSTWVLVQTGDYIIKGIKGEFYPCRESVFDETYEVA